jgi:general secretion pathway protein D
VTDLPHRMLEIEELVSTFDAKEKQVFIEAKIVTVQLTDDFKLGINWDYVIQGLDPRYKLGAAIAHTAADPESVLPSVGKLSYQTLTGGGGSLSMVLEALDNMGDTKVLSNPHVAVISGEEATVKVVTDQPYAEATLVSGTTRGVTDQPYADASLNVVGETIIFIEVGVKLSVTPVVNDNGMIRMTINPEISSVVGTYKAYRNVPIVRKSYSETTVVIKDNETVIIAGMIENATREATSSIPILGRIPLLGWLFRAKGMAAETLETIVFLTPRIISGEEPVILLRDQKKQPKPLRRVGSTRGKAMKPVR